VYLPSVPASEAVLLHFVVALAAEGLPSGTIKCNLSGVQHLQLSLGLGDPKVGYMATLQHVRNKECSSKEGSATEAKIAYYPPYCLDYSKCGRSHGMALITSCFGLLVQRATLAFSDQGKFLFRLLMTLILHTICL